MVFSKKTRAGDRAIDSGPRPVFLLIFFSFLVVRSPDGSAYRPFMTEDSGVLDPGRFELETGQDFISDGGGRRTAGGQYTLNAGILPRLEADFITPVIYNYRYAAEEENENGGAEVIKKDASGFGDLSLVGKCRVWHESRLWPAFTAAGTVFFPTGNPDKGLGVGRTGYQALGILTKSYKRLAIHWNAGWDFAHIGPDSLLLRAAADFALNTRWQAILEWDGATDFKAGKQNEKCGVLAGVIYAPVPRVKIDFGVRAGMTPKDDNVRLTAGLTVGF